ncbi:MAG: DUF4952 domain-containing protein [Leptospiraceae bacterium]|nr:DUF4952 domain-containing protein [Leptospiraceae bacterium]
MIIISILTLQCSPSKEPNSCDVFINKLGYKFQELFTISLNELDFMSCTKTKDAQLQVLRTTYLVKGRNAKLVENYLEKKYSMGKLRFLCCGWENWESEGAKDGQYIDIAKYKHSVSMYSKETLEKNWEKIQFYVDDILYLEEP